MLEPGFESFVGHYPDPMRHGMTAGELAQLFNERFVIRARSRSCRWRAGAATCTSTMTGRRGCCRRRTCRRSTRQSSFPDMVLFEGTMLSEGRGTTRPFELLGAPWIDARARLPADERAGLPGVHLLSGDLRADVSEAREDACGGCQIHVTDREISGRSQRRRAADAMFRAATAASRGGSRRTITSTTRCQSTSSPARRRFASKSTPRCRSPRSSRRLEKPVKTSFTPTCDRGSLLY